LASWCA